MSRRTRSAARIAALLTPVALVTAACGPADSRVRETLEPFMAAVQQQDFDRLYCLSGGASDADELGANADERRANFRAWATAHVEAYLGARDDGWVEPDEHGIQLTKMFALGKGTFYTLDSPRSLGPDSLMVRMDLRFGYGQLDLSRFSPGTTFYLCGAPVGRIHAVRVPEGNSEVRLEVLEGLAVDWTLVRVSGSPGCPGGWAVASAVPVEGSATTTSVTWTF